MSALRFSALLWLGMSMTLPAVFLLLDAKNTSSHIDLFGAFALFVFALIFTLPVALLMYWIRSQWLRRNYEAKAEVDALSLKIAKNETLEFSYSPRTPSLIVGLLLLLAVSLTLLHAALYDNDTSIAFGYELTVAQTKFAYIAISFACAYLSYLYALAYYLKKTSPRKVMLGNNYVSLPLKKWNRTETLIRFIRIQKLKVRSRYGEKTIIIKSPEGSAEINKAVFNTNAEFNMFETELLRRVRAEKRRLMN